MPSTPEIVQVIRQSITIAIPNIEVLAILEPEYAVPTNEFRDELERAFAKFNKNVLYHVITYGGECDKKPFTTA